MVAISEMGQVRGTWTGHLGERCQQRKLRWGRGREQRLEGGVVFRCYMSSRPVSPGARHWPFQRQPVHTAARLGPTGLLKAGGVTALYLSAWV